jgi:hypothetical protein
VAARQKARPEPKHRLPNFLIIGAMKAGTTSLYRYLRPHPQIFMPEVKELNFFAEEGTWRRGLDWYAKRFIKAAPHETALGEASPIYTQYPHHRGIPERIALHIPDAHLIYVVRDPIERIRSHYQHRVTTGAEKDPVEVAVLKNPIYLDCSRYAFQIEQYLPYVPRDRLLVITSEALRSDRLETVRRVYTFLDVATEFVPPTLDREFYRTQSRPGYPPALTALWRAARRWIPGARPWPDVSRTKELVERIGLRRRWHVAGTSETGPTDGLAIPDDARDILVRRLREDVRRLREYLPPDFDAWGLLVDEEV